MLIREIRVFEGFKTVKMKINIEKKLRKIVNGQIKGFTTIELIMAVAITGTMMAVTLPKMGLVTTIDLESVTRQVKSDIRYTQEMAMSKYRKTTIAFTADSNTYSITSSGSSESKGLPDRSRAIFDSTNSTALIFTFNSSGEPIAGAEGILRIASDGSYKEIEVEGVTGRATVQ